MSIRAIALTAVFFFACQAQADFIIIGDVDAPNTADRPQNYDLLENVRAGGTDIVWLTGGYPVNSRYTDLRSQWTTAGATITDDLTTDIETSLAGRDLVVISQLWANVSLWDSTAMSTLASYIAGGGKALYIAQVLDATNLTSYTPSLPASAVPCSSLPIPATQRAPKSSIPARHMARG